MLPSMILIDVDTRSPNTEPSVRSLGMVKRGWVESLTGHHSVTHQTK